MNNIYDSGVVILDFGSQYTQLIARRVRELNVYSIIMPPETSIDKILSLDPGALILSGGPSSIYDQNTPDFDKKILDIDLPILGICYGLHLLTHYSGGEVSSTGVGEYGFANINICETESLFKEIKSSAVWMSHGDQVTKVPNGWEVLAESSNGVIAAMMNKKKSLVATQFHPEVQHTEDGLKMLENFLFKIADCQPNWTAGNFINEEIE